MTQFRPIRNKLIAVGWVLAAVLSAATTSAALPELYFEPVREFSIDSNPNGIWSYGWTSSLGGPFNLFTMTDTFVPGISAWWQPAEQLKRMHLYVAHNDTTKKVCAFTYCVPPRWLQLVPGDAGIHSVVRWTAPVQGRITIRGSFKSLDHSGRLNSDIHVLLNSSISLLSGQIVKQGLPLSFELSRKVQPGDTIDFVVGAGEDGHPSMDSTGLQASIVLESCDICD